MTQEAIIARTENRREVAEIADDEVLPPQVYVLADEGRYGEVIRAVTRTIGAEPNAANGPAVTNRDDDEFGALTFTFRPNELPVVGDDGIEGWLPAYRGEEQIRETLLGELPEGWSVETERRGRLVLYKE